MSDITPELENWFTIVLDIALSKAGNKFQLASAIGISHASIGRWADRDSYPNIIAAHKLLRYIGGDLQRALPDWEPEAEETQFTVLGRVSAGKPTFFEAEPLVVSVPRNEWMASKYWANTMGDVVYFEVAGDSMEPEFSDGDYLAVRAPRPGMRLPDNTPCIIKTSPYEMTLKLVTCRPNGELVARPINPEHQLQFYKNGDYSIEFVVLGKRSNWQRNTPSTKPRFTQGGGNRFILREDSADY